MLRDLSAHPDTLEGIHPWKKGGFAEHPLMKMTEAPITINLIDQCPDKRPHQPSWELLDSIKE